MLKKEAIERAIVLIDKEIAWALLEFDYIKKFRDVVHKKDYEDARFFLRKASRAESRLNQFEQRMVAFVDVLSVNFPEWHGVLSELLEKIEVENHTILSKVSYVDGALVHLLKRLEWDKIPAELDELIDKGVDPLIIVLRHLKDQLEKILEKTDLTSEYEASLNKRPFIIFIHDVNEKVYANSLLLRRFSLPKYYKGRRLEWTFEVDYFWRFHKRNVRVGTTADGKPIWQERSKISSFFGHVFHGNLPISGKQILAKRYRPEGFKESFLNRIGAVLPDWLFSRSGKIKITIELKSGSGSLEEGLNDLARRIKDYHLESNILFWAGSKWGLEYVKKLLPNSITVLPTTNFFGRGISLPVVNPIGSILKWGLAPRLSTLDFVDCFAGYTRNSESKIVSQIEEAANLNKAYIGSRVRNKQQFDWLVRHGARGAMCWAKADDVLSWLKE